MNLEKEQGWTRATTVQELRRIQKSPSSGSVPICTNKKRPHELSKTVCHSPNSKFAHTVANKLHKMVEVWMGHVPSIKDPLLVVVPGSGINTDSQGALFDREFEGRCKDLFE